VIEARWLFDTPGSRIETVIHPQSICHSMVEFEDGSILAQLGATDMRIPISYAMAYPERIESGTAPVDFPELARLTFERPDTDRFPLLKAAYDALEQGDESCIVLNAADETAVELFLNDEIDFPTIPRIVLSALESISPPKVRSLDEVIDLHDSVKARTLESWRRRTG
jgi:1-deoxy-D-xylulose-5-phosphate reductoisomerase